MPDKSRKQSFNNLIKLYEACGELEKVEEWKVKLHKNRSCGRVK
jgi:hypothetical protein